MGSVRLDSKRETEVRQQLDEVVQTYSELISSQDFPDKWVLRGNIHFSANHKDYIIKDSFNVLISLPQNYPDDPPRVQETGGRIPKEFHTNPDGTLCLGVPIAVRIKFLQNPRLLSFIEEQIIPFLFSFCYWQEKRELPFGEFSHGGKGIRDYYKDIFKVKDYLHVLYLLKILTDKSYHGHLLCPCDSGIILRNCHGKQLLYLMTFQTSEQFFRDMGIILNSLSNEEKKTLNLKAFPMILQKLIEKNRSLNEKTKKYI